MNRIQYDRVKTVIYGATNYNGATAQVVFDEEACKIADIDLSKYTVEKLLINPSPSEDSFKAGWDSAPEIQFTNGKVICQNYSCTQGEFNLFKYTLI